MKTLSKSFLLLGSVFLLANCSGDKEKTEPKEKPAYPMNPDDARKLRNGRLTGEGGLKLFDGGEEASSAASPIGVNSFLWRATLDTLSFMPMTSADPFGGVILTDWYEDPKTPGERFKITAMIMDRALRSDGVKISVFKQVRDNAGQWRDAEVNKELGRKLEDTILTRAREMRIKQGGK